MMKPEEIARGFIQDRNLKDFDSAGYPFVTISRQPGAGGLDLGREIASRAAIRFDRRLGHGWHVFDQNICRAVVEDGALRDALHSLVDEEYRSESSRFMEDLIAGHDTEFEAYKALFHCARTLAQLGKVVLVGRAAALVTGNLPMGVHIRLVASEEYRLQHLMQELKVDRAGAQHALREQDRGRARLVKDFFGRDIEDPLVYDVTFTMDDLQVGEVADVTLSLVEDRVERHGLPGA